MDQVLLDELAKLNISHKRRRRWQRIVSVIAMVVVFCTTYALILPAITMHTDVLCGLEEHSHVSDCGNHFACLEDLQGITVLHTHNGVCYDDTGALVCPIPELAEHSHTDNCQKRQRICGKEEAEAHSHDVSCYAILEEPQCGQEPQQPHLHGEECRENQLICQLDVLPVHQHTDACYEIIDIISCGLTETAGHSHTDACYEFQSEYICGMELLEDHIHAEECLAQRRILACGMNDFPAHSHSELCYSQENQLSCEIPTTPHVHEEMCYELRTTCTLQETEGHSHGEACYQKMICLQEEQEGHTHDESCEETVPCLLPEIHEHIHRDGCLDENGTLICVIPEVRVHEHTESCIIWNCGMQSHVHEESCYPEAETQPTEPGFLCGFGEHTHAEGCYDETDMLICSIPEHSHTASCVLETFDPNADIETEAQWMASFAGCELTSQWPSNVAKIAVSQIGYQESIRNVVLLDDGTLKGYSRYGGWYGRLHDDWNTLFAAFCIRYSGVEGFPIDNQVTHWVQKLQHQNFYRQAAGYIPREGDLMFLDRDFDGYADWTAIMVMTDSESMLHTIQGDVDDCVREIIYNPLDPQILGYGIIPPGKTRLMSVSQDDYTVEVRVDASAMIPGDSTMIVEEILPGTAEYDDYYAQSLNVLSESDTQEQTTQIRFARFFDIRFVANGITMEPASPVEVCITYESAVEIAQDDQSVAIHFAEDGVEILDAETSRNDMEEQSTTDRFAFTQSSFSVTGTVIASGRAAIDLSNASQLTDSISQLHVMNAAGMETKIFANGDKFRIVMEGSLYSWQFTNGQPKTMYFKLSDTMRLESFTCSNGITEALIDGSSNTFLMAVPAVTNGNSFHFRIELEGTALNQTGGISYVTIRWDQYQVYSSKQTFVAQDEYGNTVTADVMGNSYSPTQYDLVVETVDPQSSMNTIESWIQSNFHRRKLEDVLLYRVYLVNKSNSYQQIQLPAPYTLVIDYIESPFEVTSQGSAAVINMNNGSASNPGSHSVSYDNGVSKVCIADQYNSLSQFAILAMNGISAGTTPSGYTLLYNEQTDAFLRDPAYSIYYNNNSPIGTAGSFHIVAFDTANLNTHTNGNLLAGTVNAYSNFGTNNYGNELTYIQNYATVNSNSASSENHVLVLGSQNTIGFYDNNNKYTVNGQGIDRPKTIIQDANTVVAPFINLNRVRAEIVQISSRLVGYQNQNIAITQYSQKNVLQLTNPAAVGVLNVKATDSTIFGKDYIQLDGFRSGNDGSIVINVDCSGVSQINMPKALVVVDGVEQGTNEVTEFSNGKVLWNFINAQGVTINTHLMTGMVIAPGATVNIMQNLNGTVVADVVNVNAESHRTDFTGKIVPQTHTDSYSATIQKVRTGYMGTTVAGAEFDLYKWNGYDWQKVNESAMVTNASGLFVLETLELDTAYQLVETKAPEGYIPMEEPYGFWVRSRSSVTQPAIKPQNYQGTAIASGAVLNITNDLDEEVQTTSLEIQKVWDTPEPPKHTSISIILYQLSWKDQELLGKKEYRSLVLSSVLDWSMTVSELPLSRVEPDGTTITYTYAVEEVPIEGYQADYSIDNEAGVSEGGITITNRVKSPDIVYALPETGGNGPESYILTGMVLVIFSGLMLMYRMIPERKRILNPVGESSCDSQKRS